MCGAGENTSFLPSTAHQLPAVEKSILEELSHFLFRFINNIFCYDITPAVEQISESWLKRRYYISPATERTPYTAVLPW